MVAQVCRPVHLALPHLVGYPGYSFTPGLNLDIYMPHAHLVRQGLKIVMKSGDFYLRESNLGFRGRNLVVEVI